MAETWSAPVTPHQQAAPKRGPENTSPTTIATSSAAPDGQHRQAGRSARWPDRWRQRARHHCPVQMGLSGIRWDRGLEDKGQLGCCVDRAAVLPRGETDTICTNVVPTATCGAHRTATHPQASVASLQTRAHPAAQTRQTTSHAETANLRAQIPPLRHPNPACLMALCGWLSSRPT